jgi:hypothetical protein
MHVPGHAWLQQTMPTQWPLAQVEPIEQGWPLGLPVLLLAVVVVELEVVVVELEVVVVEPDVAAPEPELELLALETPPWPPPELCAVEPELCAALPAPPVPR